MKHTYCALVHPAKEGGFLIDFPDFDFCKSEGDTIEEVKLMAEDVLALTIQVMQDEKKPLPMPTMDYKKLLAMADKAFGEVAFIMPVTVYTEKAQKAVHINITLPEDKLNLITDFCNACGKKRSTFLVEAALEKIERMKSDK